MGLSIIKVRYNLFSTVSQNYEYYKSDKYGITII